jgi:hypothetical protein
MFLRTLHHESFIELAEIYHLKKKKKKTICQHLSFLFSLYEEKIIVPKKKKKNVKKTNKERISIIGWVTLLDYMTHTSHLSCQVNHLALLSIQAPHLHQLALHSTTKAKIMEHIEQNH